MVVNSSNVGNVDRSVALRAFSTTIRSNTAPVRFAASSRSRAIGGSGVSNVTKSPKRPRPSSQSDQRFSTRPKRSVFSELGEGADMSVQSKGRSGAQAPDVAALRPWTLKT